MDVERIRSMINSSSINAKVAKEIKLNEETATLIFRELYESIRQLGDAKWWLLGYEPANHEVSLEILKEFGIKDKLKLNSLDRFKRIRHDINFEALELQLPKRRKFLISGTNVEKKYSELLRKKLNAEI